MFSVLRKITRRRLALLMAGALGILATALAVAVFGDLPPASSLVTRSSPNTTKILDRKGRLLYEILDPLAGRRTRLPLAEIPINIQNAVISVEDSNFYQNPGVDPVGIARAAWQDIRARQLVAGGSTITQQLARQLLLSKEEGETKSFTRKLREMLLAVRLNQTYSKQTILEMYLNETYFGNLSYGVEAASRAYFGKPARDLDLAESALLAGLIQSPTAYNPFVNYDAARARQKVALDLMTKNGYISTLDAQQAYDEHLHLAPLANAGGNGSMPAPHFVAYVRNLLEERYGAEAVNHGGLSVITTLDLDLQERAQSIVKFNVDELVRRTIQEGAPDHNLHDAALVAIKPGTGEILAMVGSADYNDTSIDGAVNVALANRQPGSAIKPVTYATAFSGDLTPATVMSDVPTTFQTKENEPYAPENYDRTWHGPISLRTALATSSNMVAVKVLDHVGLPAMTKTASRLGITTFDDSDRFGLALTLGGGEVKLLELTAAYAAFANNGMRVEPVAILSVTDEAASPAGGPSVTLSPAHQTVQAVSPQVAYLITNILSDDSARIPAFGEDSLLNLSRPAAAKTGTTTDFRDNWTVGYTPDLAVGVWAGNANNDPMYKISGITGAAPIWHDFMEEASKGTPVRDFQRPDGLVDVDVCATSGMLSSDYCPSVRSEIFIKGTEPTLTDDTYRPYLLDSATGLLWSEGCKGQRVERVYRTYPPEAQDWARNQGLPLPPEQNCLGQVATDALRSPLSVDCGSSSVSCTPSLIISSPAQNSTFELSPQLPLDLQQLEISARSGSGGQLMQITLLIDGKPLTTISSPPYTALWRLTEGEHEVKALGVESDGNRIESQTVRFTVTNAQ